MRPLSVAIVIGLLVGVSMFVATSASGTRHASPQFRDGQFHERIAALAQQQGVSVTTPQMGEAVDLEQPHAGQPWWRSLK